VKDRPKISNSEIVAGQIMERIKAGGSGDLQQDIVKILDEHDFLEHSKFVIQKRNQTLRQWETKYLHVRGRTIARKYLNKLKKKEPDHELRYVPKIVADGYQQGKNDVLEHLEERPIKRRL
jgi:hypothetical protein